MTNPISEASPLVVPQETIGELVTRYANVTLFSTEAQPAPAESSLSRFQELAQQVYNAEMALTEAMDEAINAGLSIHLDRTGCGEHHLPHVNVALVFLPVDDSDLEDEE
jgi:hypothetical protein